jgi:NDP-sugar pyrophosphorylase family protein
MTKGIILSGGWGTRLRPLTCTIPKTLIPVVNKPVMERQILLLKDAGVKEIVLAVSVMSEVIRDYFKEGNKLGVKIHYTDEKFPAGTAGAIKLAEDYLKGDNFFMLNGDVILNFDFSKMLEFHKKFGGIGTIASKLVEDPSRYGVLIADKETNKITEFLEKENYHPLDNRDIRMPINAGVYLLEPEILSMIPKAKKVSIEREIFPKLAKNGDLYHYPIEGIWKDIGKPYELLEGNFLLMNELLANRKLHPNDNLKIDKSSKIIQPSIIGENVIIGRDCTIGPNVILGEGVVIDDNSKIQDCIIYNNSHISKNVKIEKAILSNDCFLDDDVILKGIEENLIILSSHVKVLKGVRIIDPKDNLFSVCHHEIITENLERSAN